MRALEIDAATGSVAQYARDAGEEPIVFTEHGQPITALVPVEGADLETLSLSTNPDFVALIERSRARHKAEGGISSEEMRRRLGLA